MEIDARRYLDVFDIFLPPFLQPLDESVSCAFLREANLMTNLTALVGLFLMPMVQQQWFCSHEAEVTVNASFSRLSYNITVGNSSGWIFTRSSLPFSSGVWQFSHALGEILPRDLVLWGFRIVE